MTKLSAANESNLSLNNVPIEYADALVALAIGPFVSKMIFGVEQPGQKNVPSLQVSMPTNELHNLALHIIEVLQNPEAFKKIEDVQAEFRLSVLSKK